MQPKLKYEYKDINQVNDEKATNKVKICIQV
jgi:hypothetical protein